MAIENQLRNYSSACYRTLTFHPLLHSRLRVEYSTSHTATNIARRLLVFGMTYVALGCEDEALQGNRN